MDPMKHVVIQDEIRGTDIRPAKLFSRFRELAIADAERLLSDPADHVEVNCPACDHGGRKAAFEKFGYQYVQCFQCGTVYVSPRPSRASLNRYRTEGEAIRFRAGEFAETTGNARRLHVLHSHAVWMGQLYDEMGNPEANRYADIGTNYPMVFEEVGRLGLFQSMETVKPLPGLEESCRSNGAAAPEAAPRGLGLVSAFEQLEHQFSPEALLRDAWEMLAAGGLFIFTTRTISGFDLQALWEHVPYIYVPEHLNLLSIEGVAPLVERVGFELVELSTPGLLDVELTLGAMEQDPTIRLSRFADYLLRHRPMDTLADFQRFLQKNRLSSHLRVALIKR
jgi:hypothetical protein